MGWGLDWSNWGIGRPGHGVGTAILCPLMYVFTSWPLTLKFNRVTLPFLKIGIRHGAYQHEKKYHRPDIGHSLNSTCDMGPLQYDTEIIEVVTVDMAISMLTCDIGDPRQGPPHRAKSGWVWHKRRSVLNCFTHLGACHKHITQCRNMARGGCSFP